MLFVLIREMKGAYTAEQLRDLPAHQVLHWLEYLYAEGRVSEKTRRPSGGFDAGPVGPMPDITPELQQEQKANLEREAERLRNLANGNRRPRR